jgi:hypothetical protein
MFFIVGGSRSPLTEDHVVLLLSRSHSKKPLRPLQSPLMIVVVFQRVGGVNFEPF